MNYEIEELLKAAFTNQASDLHITVDSPPIFRINGQLIKKGETILTDVETEQMAKHLLSNQQYEELVKVGELDFSYQLEHSHYRINLFKQQGHIGLVARVIPSHIPSIEELQLPDILRSIALKKQGLVLVTGPTGSGKSTTLASMIDYVNRNQSKHIITLEDPIEYVHNHKQSLINQREIGFDTNSFANGLRAALRQDPDIILVGEMRDLDTISTAITAAETGHLVLSTLHTNSAAQTINRIIDVFPPHQQAQIRAQLASVLEAVISQRLLPISDGNGRIAATEILINTPSVANMIRTEKVAQINNVLQTNRSLGMHTLEMSVNQLLVKGFIRREDGKDFLSNAGEM